MNIPDLNKFICVNRILNTKDGRKIGNGIVIEISESIFGRYHLAHIKTGYGNIVHYNQNEIDEYFYVGVIADRSHKNFVY